nr:MAG TPA: hypothetical protein [Bacteriophage sp.]
MRCRCTKINARRIPDTPPLYFCLLLAFQPAYFQKEF